MQRRLFVQNGLSGIILSAGVNSVNAQSTVGKYIIPYPPGGPTDILGRIIAHSWGQATGKNVVVENKAGAAGSIGVDAIIKSPADGNHLGTLAGATVLASLMGVKPNFDILEGYTPVSMGYEIPLVMAINSNFLKKANTLQELINYAKANPGAVNYATSSYGSSAHLLAESLQGAGNFKMTYVPYKGAAPALQGLLGDEVSVIFADIVTLLPHLKSQRILPLVVGSQKTVEELPSVPTLIESGFNFHATSWNAIVAPPNLPQKYLNELQGIFEKVLNDKAVKDKMAAAGAKSYYMSPGELKNFIRSEYIAWKKIITDRQIKVEG